MRVSDSGQFELPVSEADLLDTEVSNMIRPKAAGRAKTSNVQIHLPDQANMQRMMGYCAQLLLLWSLTPRIYTGPKDGELFSSVPQHNKQKFLK